MDHTFKKKHTKPFPKEKTNMSHPSPTTTVLDPFSQIPVLLGLKLQILVLKFTGLGVISSINHISMCAASPCSWSISSGPQDCGVVFPEPQTDTHVGRVTSAPRRASSALGAGPVPEVQP